MGFDSELAVWFRDSVVFVVLCFDFDLSLFGLILVGFDVASLLFCFEFYSLEL